MYLYLLQILLDRFHSILLNLLLQSQGRKMYLVYTGNIRLMNFLHRLNKIQGMQYNQEKFHHQNVLLNKYSQEHLLFCCLHKQDNLRLFLNKFSNCRNNFNIILLQNHRIDLQGKYMLLQIFCLRGNFLNILNQHYILLHI
jgi:hypothetical protein